MIFFNKKLSNPLTILSYFKKDPYQFFDYIKPLDTRKIQKLRLGFREIYFCFHPDHSKHILFSNKNNYRKSDLVLKKIQSLSGPTGLIQLSDEQAKVIRSIAGKLMNPKSIQILSNYVEQFLEEQFDNFDEAAKKNKIVDMKEFLTQLVLRTAGIFIIGQDIKVRAQSFDNAFVELNRMAGEGLRNIFSNPFSTKKRHHLKIIHSELDQIIKNKNKKSESSLLGQLANENFPHMFIRDQIKAFMFAGYDTTASSLISSVDLIARNPKAQRNIFFERHLDFKDALYTQAVYKESLRLYPSAYFLPRQSINDDIICNQKIKSNKQIFISIRHIQRCPEIYENPSEFEPERFLEKPTLSHAFIPFGAGSRICIGAALAMMETTIVLKGLCKRYKFSAVNKNPPKIEGLITAHATSPLLVRLTKRKIIC